MLKKIDYTKSVKATRADIEEGIIYCKELNITTEQWLSKTEDERQKIIKDFDFTTYELNMKRIEYGLDLKW